MRTRMRITYTTIILIFIVFGCKKNAPNLNNINFPFEIHRLDSSIFVENIDSTKLQLFEKKYNPFWEIYLKGIIQIRVNDKNGKVLYINNFVNDYSVYALHKETSKVFVSLDGLTEQLYSSFKYYKFYFPNNYVPKVYTFIGGLNQSIVIADSVLAIGLDKYLGTSFIGYNGLFNQYQLVNMTPEKIAPDAMYALALTDFEDDSLSTLLDYIIFNGKAHYFSKKMLPTVHDSLIFGFTNAQLQYCEANEAKMYDFLIMNKLLYNTDLFTIRKFTDEGPFTKAFGNESPARASNWLGYRIVSSYLKNNKEKSFQQMMMLRDYQKIFNQSKYRP